MRPTNGAPANGADEPAPEKSLIVHHLPEDVADALEEERRLRGMSVEEAVVDLLRGALGLGGTPIDGLAAMAGAWSLEELEAFERASEAFVEIDGEPWE
jgi:hypothetical protein